MGDISHRRGGRGAQAACPTCFELSGGGGGGRVGGGGGGSRVQVGVYACAPLKIRRCHFEDELPVVPWVEAWHVLVAITEPLNDEGRW